MKKRLFSLMLLGVALSNFAQQAKYNHEYGIEINDSKVIACKVDSIKKYLYYGDELKLELSQFYGDYDHTPSEMQLIANVPVYNYDNKKQENIKNHAKKQTKTPYLLVKSSDSVVTITRVQDSKLLCTIEQFNSKDSIHQQIAWKNSGFSFKCKADSVFVGDTVSATLKFNGNTLWELNNGTIILGNDTVLCGLNVKGLNPLHVKFVVPNSLGEKCFTVYGDFKHDYFGFSGRMKYHNKLVVIEKEEKNFLNFCSFERCLEWLIGLSWHFLLLVGVALFAIVLFIVVKKNKRGKKGSKDSGEVNDRPDEDGMNASLGNASSEQPSPEGYVPEEVVKTLEQSVEDLKKQIEEHGETIKSKETEITKLNDENGKLNDSLLKAQKKVKTIAREKDKYYQERHKELEEKIETNKKKINQLTESLAKSLDEKENLNGLLNQAKIDIDNLNSAQAKFTSIITFVPFAEQYCNNIQHLIDIVNMVEKAGIGLRNITSIEDPWHIMKAITRFSSSMSEINLMQFYTEVKMICSGQIVLNDTMLCKYDQHQNADELNNSLKNYFFDTYLRRYVDAAVVLNETMAGMSGLTNGISQEFIAPFVAFRSQLIDVLASLGITVIYVSLFENIGQKLDLQVELGDFGDFPSGAILDIENCIVYLTGGNKPASKIRVKVQE